MNAPTDGQRERMRSLYDEAMQVSGPAPSGGASGRLLPGHLLGKCRIEKELGRGGMGTVYLARHATLDVPVAVKVLPPQIAEQTPEFAERFLREARLAASIRHPNVVSVMDADRDEATGLHYIVQEFVDGGSIRDRLRKGPLDEKNALRIVAGVAKALDAAAQHGIVHRDIKPDNILLTREGQVKLADLGLAKRIGDESSGLTLSDSPMGTPFYMSPEQIKDVKRVDIRSDLYSLGATLYHLLTGEPPFPCENVYGIIHKVVNDPVPDPRGKKPGLSDSAVGICRALLAKDPAQRPQTPKELLGLLRGSGTPVTVRRSAPTVRGGSRILVVLAFCFVGALAGMSLYIWMKAQWSEVPPPTRPPRQPAVVPPRAAVPIESLARGCILALSFDGPVADLSGRRHEVVVMGARAVPEGRVGGGLRFDGEDDFVDLPPLIERTVAMWVRAEESGQTGFYDGGRSETPHQAFQIGVFQPGGVNPGNSPYPDAPGVFLGFWTIDAVVPFAGIGSGWHHVVVSWDGDRRARIVLDGQLLGGAVVHHATNYASGEQPFDLRDVPEPPVESRTQIGRIRAPFWGQGGDHFRGVLDDIAVWDRPLDVEEMRSLYRFASRKESYCEAIGGVNR